jgi:polysaccharide deacetylase 2 family uncharacterized protein YibQ
MKSLALVIFAAMLAVTAMADTGTQPRISIIIDDLGYQLDAGRRAIALPGPLAYAVLPATPRGRQLAETAHHSGKEVLLHLPLQAVDHEGPDEPGGITLDMSRTVFAKRFSAALDTVPFAIGVSSHRGSLLTRHPGHMEWLMQEIHSRNSLFFIDSFTTHHSVALQIAREAGVAATKRDVFLDNDRSAAALDKAFERLKSLARQRGVAVGIGHPYPETIDFLEAALPTLAAHGYELVPISQALALRLARSTEPPKDNRF